MELWKFSWENIESQLRHAASLIKECPLVIVGVGLFLLLLVGTFVIVGWLRRRKIKKIKSERDAAQTQVNQLSETESSLRERIGVLELNQQMDEKQAQQQLLNERALHRIELAALQAGLKPDLEDDGPVMKELSALGITIPKSGRDSPEVTAKMDASFRASAEVLLAAVDQVREVLRGNRQVLDDIAQARRQLAALSGGNGDQLLDPGDTHRGALISEREPNFRSLCPSVPPVRDSYAEQQKREREERNRMFEETVLADLDQSTDDSGLLFSEEVPEEEPCLELVAEAAPEEASAEEPCLELIAEEAPAEVPAEEAFLELVAEEAPADLTSADTALTGDALLETDVEPLAMDESDEGELSASWIALDTDEDEDLRLV